MVRLQAAERNIGPWPDVATARRFLRGLTEQAQLSADGRPGDGPALTGGGDVAEVAELAQWLIAQGLGPMAYTMCREAWPELAAYLQEDLFSAVAELGMHEDSLDLVVASLEPAGISVVLLKGAALAASVYADATWRTMSDIDVWVQPQDIPNASRLLQQNGFKIFDKAERPLALQQLAGGEIRFYRQAWQQGLVELHWEALSGWWLARTAALDGQAIWSRKVSVPNREPHVYQLANEDMVIQLAVHLSVNHQLGMAAVRGLLDIALVANKQAVDWEMVAARALQWRVATATWLVLDFLEQLVGCAGVSLAVDRLQPSPLRRRLLQLLVTPESVLAARDLRSGRARYLLLLLLVDRFRDVVKLLFRTVWPDRAWLEARYRGRGGHGRHLWNILRHGQI